MPFPGFWPRSLRNQEDVPWLLGKGAGKGQLGHPGSPDSGALEAGLLVGAITGLVLGCQVPGVSLSSAGIFSSFSVSRDGVTSVISLPLPSWSWTLFPSLGGPGLILALFWVPGLCWGVSGHSVSLTGLLAVIGHSRAPPSPQHSHTSCPAPSAEGHPCHTQHLAFEYLELPGAVLKVL